MKSKANRKFSSCSSPTSICKLLDWGAVVSTAQYGGSEHSEDQFNLLKPNDTYICRTAALTSRRYILNIYSTNMHTEYFKHAS